MANKLAGAPVTASSAIAAASSPRATAMEINRRTMMKAMRAISRNTKTHRQCRKSTFKKATQTTSTSVGVVVSSSAGCATIGTGAGSVSAASVGSMCAIGAEELEGVAKAGEIRVGSLRKHETRREGRPIPSRSRKN